MIYVSRYSNPELRSGKYTAVRISIGTPKWPLGYTIAGEIKDLMPWGMLRKYSHEEFVIRYKEKLDSIGVTKIKNELKRFEKYGKPIVLLCYEDIRIDGQTCHRTTFAEWWSKKTGEFVMELKDPSKTKTITESKPKEQSASRDSFWKLSKSEAEIERELEERQISIFSMI